MTVGTDSCVPRASLPCRCTRLGDEMCNGRGEKYNISKLEALFLKLFYFRASLEQAYAELYFCWQIPLLLISAPKETGSVQQSGIYVRAKWLIRLPNFGKENTRDENKAENIELVRQ